VYKLYAESFRSAAHLDTIVTEASALVQSALGGAHEPGRA
jgi:phosphoglucomutase